MNPTKTNLTDAAALILLKDDKVYLAQRNPQIKFLGGWHAFPGGKVDADDSNVNIENCSDESLKRFIAAAARETFEEVGVLMARSGEKLTKGQIASLRDDLVSGRNTFAEILEHWGLHIDAEDFRYAGNWITPAFSPVRFDTKFFVARCPPKQTPQTFGEFTQGEFLAPREFLARRDDSQILISPPVFVSLKELAESDLQIAVENLLRKSKETNGNIDYVEINPHITIVLLRTKPLPPDTHTNCFIVGKKEFTVIDAAARDAAEQAKLHKLIDSLIENGGRCTQIIVSHLHADHFGGETTLQKHLREKFLTEVPISAHRLTAESLRGKVEFQRFVENCETFRLKDDRGKDFEMRTLHTPGHARGHLAFYDESTGFLLSSDNVIGADSVVIALPEGNLKDYLASLQMLLNLPNLRYLCGSHGTAVFDAEAKIEKYIAHRLEREKQIIEAIENGAKSTREIVEKVYAGLSPDLLKLAEKSVEAHLEKIEADKINPLPKQDDTENIS